LEEGMRVNESIWKEIVTTAENLGVVL